MTRRPLSRAVLAASTAVALAAVVGACSSTPQSSPTSAARSTVSPADTDVAITHIHAATRDPRNGDLLLATHQGLFRQSAGQLNQVGPVIDLMSFTIGPDGTYYASGHPGFGSDLPQPLGLITSRDTGATWQVASRGGQSDFHALSVGARTVIGFDGALRVTRDRSTWTERQITSPPRSLAASPGGETMLATTAEGLLRSDDDGATWRTLDPPDLCVLVTWADQRTLVAITTTGRVATSADAGETWTLGPKPLGQVEAVSAGRTTDGRIEVIAVVGTSVIRTVDAGATSEVVAG